MKLSEWPMKKVQMLKFHLPPGDMAPDIKIFFLKKKNTSKNVDPA